MSGEENVSDDGGGVGDLVNGGGGGLGGDGSDVEMSHRPVNRVRVYSANAKGPFHVFFRGIEGRAINAISLANTLHMKFKSIVEIKKVFSDKVRVIFSNVSEANKCPFDIDLATRFRVYIQAKEVEVDGVVIMELDEPEDLLPSGEGRMNGSDVKIKILEVFRMNKKKVNLVPVTREGPSTEIAMEKKITWVAGKAVRVTFQGSILPDYIILDNLKIQVLAYSQKIMHCENCLRYGHTKAFCGNKKRCAKCGLVHEDGIATCTANEYHCPNCKKAFPSVKHLCEKRALIADKTLKSAKRKHNTSFAAVVGGSHGVKRTREISNNFESLSEDENSDMFDSVDSDWPDLSAAMNRPQRKVNRPRTAFDKVRLTQKEFQRRKQLEQCAGDLNAHGSMWGSDHTDGHGQEIEDWVGDNELVILNDGRNTRIACPPATASILDLSIVSADIAIDCSWDLYENTLGSDHYPIIISVGLRGCQYNYRNAGNQNNSGTIDWRKYGQILESDLPRLMDDTTDLNKYERFIDVIVSAASRASRPARRSNPDRGENKPWFDLVCRRLWEERRTAFRDFNRRGVVAAYLAYKRIDALLRKIMKQKRSKHVKDRDIGCPKSTSELLASRLQERNFLVPDASITVYRKRELDFLRFFTNTEDLVYCTNVQGLVEEFGVAYKSEEWRLFIDASKRSLKAVLLNSTGKYASLPLAHSTTLKENIGNMKLLIEKLNYEQHQWKICCDIKVMKMLLGQMQGRAKYPCFLCTWDSQDLKNRWKKTWPRRTDYLIGSYSIIGNQLVNPKDCLFPPLHIKLGLMTQFTIAVYKTDEECFLYIRRKFPNMSEDKMSDEQGEQFHQQIKEMERRYQGRWDHHMLADYCWSLHRDIPNAVHKKQSPKLKFIRDIPLN
ncbi:hypothetical protein DMENIID0001_140440 [Sergentomyia squamirostris]